MTWSEGITAMVAAGSSRETKRAAQADAGCRVTLAGLAHQRRGGELGDLLSDGFRRAAGW